ncbi:MAG: hypothetical protein KGO50_01865 [Myxococcales bacterium]|nr:hypothetical protein [Myxococcales bacterium]
MSATNPAPYDRVATALAVLGLACTAVLVTWQQIGDWDTWWHLRMGQYMVQTGLVPAHDLFSWTWADAPIHYLDAGSQVLLWLAYALAGDAGTQMLRTSCAVGVALAIRYATGSKAAQHPLVWTAVASFLLVATVSQFIPRPLMCGTLCAAWLFAFLVRLHAPDDAAHETSTHGWRLWLAAAATVAVWMHVHRGAVLGVLLLTGAAGWSVLRVIAPTSLQRFTGGVLPARALLPAATAALLAWLSGLATVNGTALYATAFSLNGNAALRASVSEWQPLTLAVAMEHYPLPCVLIALAACVVVVDGIRCARAAQPPSVHLWHVAVAGLLFWQATTAVRHVGLATLFAAMLLARVLSTWSLPRIVAPGLLALALGVAGVSGAFVLRMHDPGMGPVPNRFPDGALAFAREHQLGDRVLNAFVYGGWVLWDGRLADDGSTSAAPRFRAAVDGRHDTVYPVEFVEETTRAQFDPAAFDAWIARYNPDWVLADNTPGRETHGFLAQRSEWMMVYWSEQAVIWLRRDRYPALQPLSFRLLHPLLPMESIAQAIAQAAGRPRPMQQIGDEIQRLIDASPQSLRAQSLALLYWSSLGPAGAAQADQVWDAMLEVHAEHPAMLALAQQFGRTPP